MVNQTLIPTEKKYPERQVLNDKLTSWELVVPSYKPQLYPNFELIAERLLDQGIEVADVSILRKLAWLSTAQATEIVGPNIAEIRHPLGRTGINGTGIYYKAGKSQTADMAILRDERYNGLELVLVYNRGKWRLPGGFIDPADNGDLRTTAIREGIEETGLDLTPIANQVETLIPEHVKPNSSRSVDMGYVTSQVEYVVLLEAEMGDGLKASDDAEEAEWFDASTVLIMGHDGRMSKDHHEFALNAFRAAQEQKKTKQ